MRFIKFRGRVKTDKERKKRGDFVYGDYFKEMVDIEDGIVYEKQHFIYEPYGDHFMAYEIYEDSLCQFTERFDKNEKEIYQGDILRDQIGVGVVDWSFVENGWVVMDTEHNRHRFTGDGYFILKNTEIIGNWHSCGCEEHPCVHTPIRKKLGL